MLDTEKLLDASPTLPTKKTLPPWPDGVPIKETFTGSKVTRHPKAGCILSMKQAQDLGGKLPEVTTGTTAAGTTAEPEAKPVEIKVLPTPAEKPFVFEPDPERTISQERPLPDFSGLPGASTPSPAQKTLEQAAAATAGALVSNDYRKNAELTFDTATSLLAGFIGPEWGPGDLKMGDKVIRTAADERESVVAPLAKLYEIKQMPDIPPGWALAIAVVAYAAPRFRVPNTREKTFGLWLKVKGLFGRFKKSKLEVMK